MCVLIDWVLVGEVDDSTGHKILMLPLLPMFRLEDHGEIDVIDG